MENCGEAWHVQADFFKNMTALNQVRESYDKKIHLI